MLLTSDTSDHWRLLTLKNVQVRKQWGWAHSIQKIVAASEPKPRQCRHLLMASDYGGEHKKATHLVYCFLVVKDARDWLVRTRRIRNLHLPDNRTLSYKRLGDPARQRALIPFLEAAANIDGHLIAIAVDKRKKWLCAGPGDPDPLPQAMGLKSRWNGPAFEALLRKVHFASALFSIWAQPYASLSWITDEDRFVANDVRHDDALRAAAIVSGFYCNFPLETLSLVTTGQDPERTEFEDLCAIPDLAAGMLSEVAAGLRHAKSWEDGMRKVVESEFTPKGDLVANWFWDEDMYLRKTLITIDVEDAHFRVRKVWMQAREDDLLLPNLSPAQSAEEGTLARKDQSIRP
jgi:hypothetical protein